MDVGSDAVSVCPDLNLHSIQVSWTIRQLRHCVTGQLILPRDP